MTEATAVDQNRRLSIIDVSSADDSLILPLSTLPENEDILYTPNSKMFEDATTKLEQWEREPNSNETTTSQRANPNKNTKCNLRKSLAWDTAFFTNAGVLDAEELCSIIEGVEKDEKHEIEEDLYKSCESISTLGSDSLTFDESVEGDLFEDIRASIQKSSKKSNLASDYSKVPSGIAGLQIDDSSKKVGMASRNKMKAPPASKNPIPIAGMQGLGKMTKRNPIFPQLPQKPVAMRRESSISRQSKVAGKSSSSSSSIISAKRVSIGDIHDKSEKDKAKRIIGDRVSSTSKASVIGGSRGNVPKPTPSAKSSSGPLASAKTKSTTFTPSANNLSVGIGKSPFNSIKRKVGTGTLKPPSSSSTIRTPSRIASSNKIETGNSSLSRLMSVTKLSSSISPTSSISDWSSESSSSTFMAKHMCDSSRTSIDSFSSRKVLSDTEADQGTNSQTLQRDSSLEGQEITGFISQTARNAPGGTILPPALVKPSGLRLPSPKIGFFDGVKSSVRTPRGGPQPHPVVSRGLPKHGVGSPSEGQNKAKFGKLQAARSIVSIETTKPNNEQINDMHPLNGVNNQENAQYDNQVGCLSKQVGLMDITFEKGEKLNGDSLSFSQSDISFQDKSNDQVLSSHKELLKSSSTPCLSISPTSFDMAASIRTPFAVKDSFCNIDGSVFTESAVSEVKRTNLTVPESIMEENN